MKGKEEFERGMENHQKLFSLDQQLPEIDSFNIWIWVRIRLFPVN